jgi:hypothetical protein
MPGSFMIQVGGLSPTHGLRATVALRWPEGIAARYTVR